MGTQAQIKRRVRLLWYNVWILAYCIGDTTQYIFSCVLSRRSESKLLKRMFDTRPHTVGLLLRCGDSKTSPQQRRGKTPRQHLFFKWRQLRRELHEGEEAPLVKVAPGIGGDALFHMPKSIAHLGRMEKQSSFLIPVTRSVKNLSLS